MKNARARRRCLIYANVTPPVHAFMDLCTCVQVYKLGNACRRFREMQDQLGAVHIGVFLENFVVCGDAGFSMSCVDTFVVCTSLADHTVTFL